MIDLSELPTRLTVAVGERTAVMLPSYFGSGNAWSAVAVRGREVARVWVETVVGAAPPAPPGDGSAAPPPLRAAPERAVVAGLAPGEAVWRLVLARPFAPDPPTASHEFRVSVTE